MEKQQNLDGPVEIGPGTFWVGSAAKELLKRNVYLRVFKGGGKTMHLLIDPGPPADLETVSRKASQVIGALSDVHFAYDNHQDPDVIGSAPQLLKLNPKLLFLMTEDTWRLAQYYGIPKVNCMAVERFSNQATVLLTGHTLRFIPTPFCHFRGACMLYDPETRILFTGDLFGGIAVSELMAGGANWTGIKAFHELYMPSNEALRLAVKRIRELDPLPLMIAPQHGGILSGALVEQFLDRMSELRVGLDIISSLYEKVPLLITAVNDILKAAREMLGDEVVQRVLRLFQPDGSYPAIFALSQNGNVSDVKAEPFAAIESLTKQLFKMCSDEQKRALQLKILVIFVERDLPPIESVIDWEEPVEKGLLDRGSPSKDGVSGARR